MAFCSLQSSILFKNDIIIDIFMYFIEQKNDVYFISDNMEQITH